MKIFLVVVDGCQFFQFIAPDLERESNLMGGFPSMKVQLAGSESRTEMLAEQKKKLSPYILDSFFNVTPTTEKYVKFYGD